MGILRTDRVSGLGGANAIKGSVFFGNDGTSGTAKGTSLNIVDANDKADLNFAGNDFTFEAWVFPSNNIAWNLLYGQSWGLQIYIDTSSTGKVKVYVGSNDTGSYAITGAESANGTINADAWNHVAFSRSGNSWTIFTNGTAATSSTSSQSLVSSNADYTIGIFNSIGSGNDAGSYYGFNGFISNLRIRTGAHYLPSTNFTPPVGELQKTSDTVLLACQSPGDITKEATGKTLVPTSKKVGDISNLNSALPKASHFTPNSPVGFSTTTDVGTQFGSTFDGVTTFDSQAYMVPPGGNTRERNRGRAVLSGGLTNPSPNGTTTMEFFNIQSGGLTQDFGTLSEERKYSAGLASPTRGVIGGSDGNPAWVTGTMEFVTIANTSNTTTFGNMTATGGMVSACSNNTRGIYFSVWDASGSGPSHKGHIDFITIATVGNSSDFGELSVARPEATGFSSPTRGICAGGYPTPDGTTMSNVIDFVTIASAGNATDFGDLTQARQAVSGASSQTRGLVAGGYIHGSPSITYGVTTIDFVTIATTGNALDFGDLTTASSGKFQGNGSDQTRGIFAGGRTGAGASEINTIDFVTIATAGHGLDFGDLTRSRQYGSVLSDSHGGIS